MSAGGELQGFLCREQGHQIELSWHQLTFSLTVTCRNREQQHQVLNGLVVEKCQTLSTLTSWLGNKLLSHCCWVHVTLSLPLALMG